MISTTIPSANSSTPTLPTLSLGPFLNLGDDIAHVHSVNMATVVLPEGVRVIFLHNDPSREEEAEGCTEDHLKVLREFANVWNASGAVGDLDHHTFQNEERLRATRIIVGSLPAPRHPLPTRLIR